MPDLELAALDGGPLALGELRGRDTLLLFWNPDCGFCRSMHEEILRWEQSSNGDGHRLVVVSSDDEERTRADGFRSLVLLDQGFAAGEAFGAGGTPMAVLLGADGRIASALAGGAEAVMALVSRGSGIAGGPALEEEGWRAVS
ncbi:MAG: TlpA family protein disulfide reductase [Gaiellaceae bacterium]